MSKFIQIHMLTNYGPSNLNRDDLGRPKTARLGGIDRLRISSQCLKRTWRTSDVFESAMGDNIGTRTKRLGIEVYHSLLEKGMSETKAIKCTKKIAEVFGKLKKEDKENKEHGLEIEQLVHVSPEERKNINSLINNLVEESREPTDEDLKLLRKNTKAVDIAMFGRMLASSPQYNTEAAIQVSHALSVNGVVIEDDYFTAVDDLNDNTKDMGSAHIDETNFGSGLFYSYICINKDLLKENLGNDTELTNKSIKSLIEAAATVAPSGKQNSFASRSIASYILIEKGDEQPRNLDQVFNKPINSCDVDEAAKRIETFRGNQNRQYGNRYESEYCMNSESGTFDEILAFSQE